MPSISVVTACFNEAGNLPTFRRRLDAVLAQLPMEAQIVLVDDCSTDETAALARQWADEDPRVLYLRFSKNFGSHAGLSAGMQHCTGDCTVFLAADLQTPPETIPAFLEAWNEGYEVVWASQIERRGESFATLLFSRVANGIISRFVLPGWPMKAVDFMLIDRKVVLAYNCIHEKHTSVLATILWTGYRQKIIPYKKEKRFSGRSKWTFSRKVKLLIDTVVSFSYTPIRLMSVVGIGISLMGFAYALATVVRAMWGNPIEGWSSLMVVILILGGFQLLMLGILGEYLWRTYDQASGRPRYIINHYYGHSADQAVLLKLPGVEAPDRSSKTA